MKLPETENSKAKKIWCYLHEQWVDLPTGKCAADWCDFDCDAEGRS